MSDRKEKDALGEVLVPEEKYWGAQTQRSLSNFRIGPYASMPREVIRAFGYVKKASAIANCELGVLSPEKMHAIARVCDEIIAGELFEHFPLVIWQTGSGTHTNMNVNEVIANRAHLLLGKRIGEGKRLLHPNDDVNMSQSSNDVFPTAMYVAAYSVLSVQTIPGARLLLQTLAEKAGEFRGIVKTGRTHLMDAAPLTLGQEFSGYATQIGQAAVFLEASMPELAMLASGGTAVGTGLNAPAGFAEKTAGIIAALTGYPFITAPDKFAALASHDALVASHGALKRLAVTLMKIANDIRLLASGPRCGIGELVLPANEPGSSIMPGKVNPTQAEALCMVCAQVMGNDVTLSVAGAGGMLELNVYKPVMISAFLQSAELLGDACVSFADKCVGGILPERSVISRHLAGSLMLVTALNPHIGYDRASEIARKAEKEKISLREAVILSGYATGEQFDEWVDPWVMTGSFSTGGQKSDPEKI
ncbi:MAG: class II fumarate hydratase [Chlorobium limicola]|uniref:Fumarate hydratase class II n=1 Tax=Chlorobium limicola (strain DSM 245 / NBRC 103803 / 6330) TaxID=290315 RepID=B3EI45_CHLL2|nr:class II fumarate hydratase [Chlorobium limicola]ACD89875.1 fumarate hydratase, class II [Chlorobium limicola DSM 245]NTV19822.1 class II fumarate hydratase [Chlorobium limicola]